MKKSILVVLTLFFIKFSFSQNVGVNSTGTNPHPSAILDVDAAPNNNKGFLMPRLTSAERKTIVAPATGLEVYDITLKGHYTFDGTKWDCSDNPAGTVNYFANIIAPNGYLECNGQAVNRIIYAELFTAIGTLYGVGDGSTTFNVPDLRGEFIRGWDNVRGIDAGRTIGSMQKGTALTWDVGNDAVHSISVINNGANNNPTVGADNINAIDYPGVNQGYAAVGGFNTIPTNDPAWGTGGVTRPRNLALMPCIKF